MLLAAASLLVAGTDASAAARRAIEGAGSFNDAPVIAPGSYRDTIRVGESLFYAVELQPGQRLVVRSAITTLSLDPTITGSVALNVYNPLRQECFCGRDGGALFGRGQTSVYRVATETIGSRGDSYATYRRYGGLYYVNVTLEPRGPRRREYPLRLDVHVGGQPVAAAGEALNVPTHPGPPPVPPERAPADAPAASTPPSVEEPSVAQPSPETQEPDPGDAPIGEAGGSLSGVLGIGLAGFLTGALGGAISARAGRRRHS